MEQYHHYIPRFILRKYASKEDTNTKMFICCGVSHSIQLSTKPKNKKKNPKNKNPYINVMTSDGVLKKEKISILYGVTNMYKDPKAKDAMEVEKLLAEIESNVASLFQRIITDEATQQNTKLTRQELNLIKKFLFVMSYRKDRRRNQYINDNFDFLTGMMMRKFMEDNKIESPQTVWLNNIRAILEAPDLERLLTDGSIPLFPTIRTDLQNLLRLYFVCLWKTPPGTEFLISDSAFGLWEGSGHTLIYHQFYPVSPTIMLVLCSVHFKTDDVAQAMSSMVRNSGARPSWFENVPHPTPKTFYNKTVLNHVNLFRIVDQDPLNEYVYSFVEISKEAINRINAITIDESTQISFLSELAFYKSLKYYIRVRREMWNGKDVKPMVQELLKNLR